MPVLSMRFGRSRPIRHSASTRAWLLRIAAAKAGIASDIKERLCDGNFGKLRSGDCMRHPADVRSGFAARAHGVYLIVLAQASIAEAVTSEGLAAAVPFMPGSEAGVAAIAYRLGTA